MIKTKPNSNPKAAHSIGTVPAHVAVIMDGNGRWARSRGLPRLAGHKAGTENIRKVIRCFSEYGVRYLTIFAFSTENWNRPSEEVKGLMSLLKQVILKETRKLHKEGVRVRHLGRLDRLGKGLKESICQAVDLTKDNKGLTLNVAFDYGGRDEILEAVRGMINNGFSSDQITEDTFKKFLYSADTPDPDLIIRTGGEMRISNFLLWQSAYSEFYSTARTWPEFNEQEIENALTAYSQRQRRFGNVTG